MNFTQTRRDMRSLVQLKISAMKALRIHWRFIFKIFPYNPDDQRRIDNAKKLGWTRIRIYVGMTDFNRELVGVPPDHSCYCDKLPEIRLFRSRGN